VARTRQSADSGSRILLFYIGMRFFVALTPVAAKRTDVILIENLDDYYDTKKSG
jgi:hypothetical protein